MAADFFEQALAWQAEKGYRSVGTISGPGSWSRQGSGPGSAQSLDQEDCCQSFGRVTEFECQSQGQYDHQNQA
jgi:hypothetical protein